VPSNKRRRVEIYPDSDGESDISLRFGHQGLYHDTNTGLVYNRNRMLHTELGRFTSRDPLGYVDGRSLYQYVNSNPITGIDPRATYTLGQAEASLCEEECGDIKSGRARSRCMRRCKEDLSDKEVFKEWHRLEEQDQGWRNNIADCPDEICISNGEPVDCNNGQWESIIEASQRYHPNATWTMRSNTYQGPGQQCNYDSKGDLITSGLEAGTPDRQAPSILNSVYLGHYRHDVAPFNRAWALDGGPPAGKNLKAYLEVRPPSQGGGSCYK
jgi:RHS repeat-associated protein